MQNNWMLLKLYLSCLFLDVLQTKYEGLKTKEVKKHDVLYHYFTTVSTN